MPIINCPSPRLKPQKPHDTSASVSGLRTVIPFVFTSVLTSIPRSNPIFPSGNFQPLSVTIHYRNTLLPNRVCLFGVVQSHLHRRFIRKSPEIKYQAPTSIGHRMMTSRKKKERKDGVKKRIYKQNLSCEACLSRRVPILQGDIACNPPQL